LDAGDGALVSTWNARTLKGLGCYGSDPRPKVGAKVDGGSYERLDASKSGAGVKSSPSQGETVHDFGSDFGFIADCQLELREKANFMPKRWWDQMWGSWRKHDGAQV
jgi:hypothetical protein